MTDQGNEPQSTKAESAAETASGQPRRNMLSATLAGVLSVVLGAVPAVIGSIFFLDPLLRKRNGTGDSDSGSPVEKDEEGRIKLPVTLDGLPEDGTPQRVTVNDDVIDAWNKFLNVPVGTVWLRRIENQVIAFNTICPHLGCSVDYRSSNHDFYCPCHASAFDLDGKKQNPVPPRDMDSLEVDIKDGKELWLKYQEFRGAVSEKEIV